MTTSRRAGKVGGKQQRYGTVATRRLYCYDSRARGEEDGPEASRAATEWSESVNNTLATCPADGANPGEAIAAASSSSFSHSSSLSGILARRVVPARAGRPPLD